jgi:succinate dehydrogenase/fumarate reductase flavoprotein subunit
LQTPKKIDDNIRKTIELYSSPLSDADYDIPSLKTKLKSIMWDNVGIIRSEETLLKAKDSIKKLINDFKRNRKCINQEEYEYRNMLTVSSIIIEAALNRKESRGAHSRSDYKQINETAEHSCITKKYEEELVYVK